MNGDGLIKLSCFLRPVWMEGGRVDARIRADLGGGGQLRLQPQVFPDSSPHLSVSHGKHLNSWLQMHIPATAGPKGLILIIWVGTPPEAALDQLCYWF